MVYKFNLNKTEFVVYVCKNGGRTDVYRNKHYYFSGQYFPDRKLLWCPTFNFEAVRKLIQDSINARIQPGDIIFPYYDGDTHV